MAGRPGSGWGFRPGHRRPLRKPGALPGVRERDRLTPQEEAAIGLAQAEGRVTRLDPAVAEGALSAAEPFRKSYARADGHVPGKPRSG